MNYFQARKYFSLFESFQRLAYEYWQQLPEQHPSDMVRFQYQENLESLAIRTKIAQLLPHVEQAAGALNISYTLRSCPPAAIGGPIIPVNIFSSVINPQIGWDILSRTQINDTINEAISVAREVCRASLVHMLLPWNWFIDSCALVIKIPFLILRRAGVPPAVEENIFAHALKVIATIGLLSLLSWLGYKSIPVDIARIFGK